MEPEGRPWQVHLCVCARVRVCICTCAYVCVCTRACGGQGSHTPEARSLFVTTSPPEPPLLSPPDSGTAAGPPLLQLLPARHHLDTSHGQPLTGGLSSPLTGGAGEACPRILSPSQPGRAPAGGAGGAGTPASASVLHPGCWVPAPAAPASSPAAAGSALGPLGPSGPVGPAAGPHAAARPPRPGPAAAGQPAPGAAGPGPAPALPSGPGGERGRLTAVHSPLGPMCLCPALSWPTGLCWGAGPSPGVTSGPQPRLGHGPPDGPPGWGHVGFNGTPFLLGRIGRLTG